MPTSKPNQRLFPSLVFLAFIGVGAIAAYQQSVIFRSALAPRSWTQASCTILSSAVMEQSPYRATVSYAYRADGQNHTGDVLYDNYNGTEDYYDAQKIVNRYPPGAISVCRVDPADPSRAVLEMHGLWSGLMILLSLLVVAGGAIGLRFVWRKRPAGASSFSVRHSTLISQLCFFLFFCFGAVGLGSHIPTLLTALAARNWAATPCVIVSTGIESRSSGSHGHAHYLVTVLFHYTYDGTLHGSSRNGIFTTFYSSSANAQLAADDLLQKHFATCFVNLADPDEAVLDRTYAGAVTVTLFVTSLFMLIGAAGIFYNVKFARRNHHRRSGKSKRAVAKINLSS